MKTEPASENDNLNKEIIRWCCKCLISLGYTLINSTSEVEAWAKRLVTECQEALAKLLPFRENEIEFLERLQRKGEIAATLISNDNDFCRRIIQHPSLLWRMQRVLEYAK